MKKIIKHLDDATAALEGTINKRTEYFESKSDKWQESEKGEEYQYLTDRLQEMYDEIYDYISELQDN